MFSIMRQVGRRFSGTTVMTTFWSVVSSYECSFIRSCSTVDFHSTVRRKTFEYSICSYIFSKSEILLYLS